MCIEVDLTKPLVAQFWLYRRWNSVEYEVFNVICFSFGKYGHFTDKCPDKPALDEENQSRGDVGTPQNPLATNSSVNQDIAQQTTRQSILDRPSRQILLTQEENHMLVLLDMGKE